MLNIKNCKPKHFVVGGLSALLIAAAVGALSLTDLHSNEVEASLLKPASPINQTWLTAWATSTTNKTVLPKLYKLKLPTIRFVKSAKTTSFTVPGLYYGILAPTCDGKWVIYQPLSNGGIRAVMLNNTTITLPSPNQPVQLPNISVTGNNGPVQLSDPGTDLVVSVPDKNLQIYSPTENSAFDLSGLGTYIDFPANRNTTTFHSPVCLTTKAQTNS